MPPRTARAVFPTAALLLLLPPSSIAPSRAYSIKSELMEDSFHLLLDLHQAARQPDLLRTVRGEGGGAGAARGCEVPIRCWAPSRLARNHASSALTRAPVSTPHPPSLRLSRSSARWTPTCCATGASCTPPTRAPAAAAPRSPTGARALQGCEAVEARCLLAPAGLREVHPRCLLAPAGQPARRALPGAPLPTPATPARLPGLAPLVLAQRHPEPHGHSDEGGVALQVGPARPIARGGQ